MIQKNKERISGRANNQARPVSLTYNSFGYADASVLLTMGNTKVLCTVTMQAGVPLFLKGSRTGWLTAEYALLPTSTQQRTQREGAGQKANGRSIEIARFIGRSLRTMVDLTKIGERTITIDCDVLQADGGTRTACITGASLALKAAAKKWVNLGLVQDNPLVDDIAALSVGLAGDQALLDIDYQEDMTINADYNFVLTRSGDIVEIQGTAEKGKVSWQQFQQMCLVAQEGINALFATLDSMAQSDPAHAHAKSGDKAPLFSLKNRLNAVR